MENEMDRYAKIQTKSAQAALILRADLHRAFDKPDFVLIPKTKGIVGTHFLGASVQHRNPISIPIFARQTSARNIFLLGLLGLSSLRLPDFCAVVRPGC